MSDEPIDLKNVLSLPLQTTSQAKAIADKSASLEQGRLTVFDPKADNPEKLVQLMRERLTRALATSLTGCVHCGLCAEACHYALARPDDPAMTPAHKADQIRRIFKRRIDWTGRVLPSLVHAGAPQNIEELNELKNMVFGTCSACRRCTYNCPMGVDNAALIRFTRGILTELGIVPEGVFNVSRDQWETGNQMGVSETDYLETLDWVKEELQAELGNPNIEIPVDRENCDFMYSLNPREIKFDPRSVSNAAKVFAAAGETWTLPELRAGTRPTSASSRATTSWAATSRAISTRRRSRSRRSASSSPSAATDTARRGGRATTGRSTTRTSRPSR